MPKSIENMLIVHRLVSDLAQSNTYVLQAIGYETCAIVDPASAGVGSFIGEHGLKPNLVLLTHEHYDHVAIVDELASQYGCEVICTQLCAQRLPSPEQNLSAFFPLLARFSGKEASMGSSLSTIGPYSCQCRPRVFSDNIVIKWQGHTVRGVATPGHTDASACFLVDGVRLFSGDTLLRDTATTTVLPTGSKKAFLDKTMPFVCSLPGDCYVEPGHGEGFLLERWMSQQEELFMYNRRQLKGRR